MIVSIVITALTMAFILSLFMGQPEPSGNDKSLSDILHEYDEHEIELELLKPKDKDE